MMDVEAITTHSTPPLDQPTPSALPSSTTVPAVEEHVVEANDGGQHARQSSTSSLEGTRERNRGGDSARRSSSIEGRGAGAGLLGVSTIARTGFGVSNRPLSTHSSSVLPSAAFFHPRAVRASVGADPGEPRRVNAGPLITRIKTEYSPRGQEEKETRRFSGDETVEAAQPVPLSRRLSFREVQDGGGESATAGGTDRHVREFSIDEPSISAHSQDHSTSSHHPLALSGIQPVNPKASREPLVEPSPLAPRLPRVQPGHSYTKSDESRLSRHSIEAVVKRLLVSSPSREGPVGVGEGGEHSRRSRQAIQSTNDAEISTGPTFVPRLDSTGKKIRNYQVFTSANRFYLGGRLLSSSDNPIPFLLCLLLSFLLPILFLAFSGPYLVSQLGAGGKAAIAIFVWLSAIMITSMCKTAWTDPGIIPRGLDPLPERKWVEDLGGGEGVGGWKAEPRYTRIKEGVVASKWCETCATYRPPRTSHCRLCDNCVDHTDHHCTFLNNCIGRRNYTSFIAFLVSAVLCAIYAIAFSAYHISRRHLDSLDPTSPDYRSAWSSRSEVAGSFFVAIVSFLLLVPVMGLLSYHVRLLWTNSTTIEMLRPKAERGGINPETGESLGNPYALRSPLDNVFSLLCRPMEVSSWISPRGYAMEESRRGEGEKGEVV